MQTEAEQTQAVPLAYAVPTSEASRYDRVWRTVAGFALAYAIYSLVTGGLSAVSLSMLAGAVPWRSVMPAFVPAIFAVPLAIGAVLMWRRRDAGALWVRYASLATMLASAAAVLWRYAAFALDAGGTGGYTVGWIAGSAMLEVGRSAVSTSGLLFFLTFPLRHAAR